MDSKTSKRALADKLYYAHSWPDWMGSMWLRCPVCGFELASFTHLLRHTKSDLLAAVIKDAFE